MPNSPSSSFIPKQGPAKHSSQLSSRQVNLFTVFSYVIFFGALVGSVAIFLYSKHTENRLDDEVVALNSSIASFSEIKMEQVRVFNIRLQQSADRLKHSVSTVAVLEALEEATAKAASIESLQLKRINDEKFILTAEVSTDSFDSSLFQRGVFERSPIVESVLIEDLSLVEVNNEDEGVFGGPKVSFRAELEVPLVEVPYTNTLPIDAPEAIEQSTAATSSASSSQISELNGETL
jgi:hypothetical protein